MPLKPLILLSMPQRLSAYFSRYRKLSDHEKTVIEQHAVIKSLPKGASLLREGEAVRMNFFVLKGCIRQYYLADGQENTSNFFTEDDWIMPFVHHSRNGLSAYYLECLEETQLVVADNERGNAMLREFPEFQQIAQEVLEQEIMRQQHALAKYINESAEQRYLSMQESRPDLINRLPQYLIASYIGVKPESLSRIRRRIVRDVRG